MGTIFQEIGVVFQEVVSLFAQASPSVWLMFGIIAIVSVVLPIVIAVGVVMYLRRGPGKAIVLFINNFGERSFDNAKESYIKTIDDLKLLEKSV